MQLKSGLRFKDGNPVTPAANQAYQWAFGQGPRRAGRSPSHLRPGAAWRLRRPPDRPQAASRPRGSLEPAPHHALHVGGPGPSAAGRGARAPLLWPWPPLAFLALCALPTPICPCSVGRAGEVVDDLCLDLSAPGLLIRWCLSGFRSCQMGLPEPVGAGWGGSGSPSEGLEAASRPWPSRALPPPRPRGLPPLPHQDTEHCMNSGLNGIISEFWSTANSGCFTNCPSLPCGGQSRARGRNGCRGPATFRGRPEACGQVPPVSAGGSGPGQGRGSGGWGQAPGGEGWMGRGARPDWGSTRGSTPTVVGPGPGPRVSPLPPGPWRRGCKAHPPAHS